MNFVNLTSTKARVFRLGDNVGLTPLAARTSSGVLMEMEGREKEKLQFLFCSTKKYSSSIEKYIET